MTQPHTLLLNNGVPMPLLGLGVYKTNSPEEMRGAVAAALEAGYRSFDTAQMYGNEALLGETLQGCGVPRGELFLASKLDLCNMSYDRALSSFEESLARLRTDYLDLFFIHWPGQRRGRLLDAWRALERLYEEGRVRALGVCNCTVRHLEWLLEESRIPPAVNQVEHHPLLNETALYGWCGAHGIALEAWAPLMRGRLDLDPLLRLAQKYGCTPAQIVLRWDLQRGFAVIPKSVHRDRIFENAAIFDRPLEEDDLALLDSLHTGCRTSGKDPAAFDF